MITDGMSGMITTLLEKKRGYVATPLSGPLLFVNRWQRPHTEI